MAKLTARTRKRIPSAEFGEPGARKYPVEDKPHARDAKAYASKEANAGKLSRSAETKIDKKANARLRSHGK